MCLKSIFTPNLHSIKNCWISGLLLRADVTVRILFSVPDPIWKSIYSRRLGIPCKEQESVSESALASPDDNMQIANGRVQVHSNMWHFSQLIVFYIFYFWKPLEICVHDTFPFPGHKKDSRFTVKSTSFMKVTREKLLAFSSILFPLCIVNGGAVETWG